MLLESVNLTGIRANLTPLRMEHIEELYEASMNPEIWTYLPEKVGSLEDTRRFVETALLQKELGIDIPFVVVDQQTNKIVGSTRLMNISKANRNLEIGWTWYNPSVWRTRMNTECKYLLLKHSFEVLQVVRVQINADLRNTRSNNAIKRLGAIQEGVLRKHRILSDGYIRDTCVYSIIEEDWSRVKSELEYLLMVKYNH